MKYYARGGWWFPDEEEHLIAYMENTMMRRHDRFSYQFSKYERAKKYVKQRRCAIDIGAHVGLWTYPMSFDFQKVIAFEPSPKHRECWVKNVEAINVSLYPYALGTVSKDAFLITPLKQHTGNTMISTISGEGVAVQIRTLDSFEFKGPVDFIKIDCEGYEQAILQGAEKSLLAWKPTIVVEQRGDGDFTTQFGFPRTGAVDYLVSLGAVVREDLSHDFVLSWD